MCVCVCKINISTSWKFSPNVPSKKSQLSTSAIAIVTEAPLHGLLHLRQQLLRHRRRSSRHQALVALKVQEVQWHQLPGMGWIG